MRIYYDTEFLEDGRTIELISIGLVAEDGRELYLVNADMPVPRIVADDWLMRHVAPHLPGFNRDYGALFDADHPAVLHEHEIADRVPAGTEHHALADARRTAAMHEYLRRIDRERRGSP